MTAWSKGTVEALFRWMTQRFERRLPNTSHGIHDAEAALGNFLWMALGLRVQGRWSERKYLLFELLIQYGVECLVFDDAHDLSMPHLIFLKELTDQLKLTHPPYALGSPPSLLPNCEPHRGGST